jgi:hypothetical protein
MPTSFSSLVANGGLVSEVVVEVVRKYPLVFARVDQNGTTSFVSEKVGNRETYITYSFMNRHGVFIFKRVLICHATVKSEANACARR